MIITNNFVLFFTFQHYNFQKRIDNEAETIKPVNTSVSEFGWENYYHMETIYAWLDHLAEKYSDMVTILDVGKSYEGAPLKGIKLSFKKNTKNNTIVFVEGGIHAKEWISPATTTFILNQLLTSNNSQVRDIAENFDWIFFPLFNPDGYKYTFQVDRLWRKSRKPYGRCYGVDLNRNWDFRWNTVDEDEETDPCGRNFAGPYAFSDPESAQLSHFMKTQRIHTYLSFHSASQKILFPYAAISERVPNYKDLKEIGEKAKTAIEQKYQTHFDMGDAYGTIYPASGTSMDYAYSELNVPIVFCIELRRAYNGYDRFLLPANQITSAGMETLDSVIAILNEARNRGYYDTDNNID